MAEAPEHSFLSRHFLAVLQEFSRLNLYEYAEADRRKFDFACSIQRDWHRVLIGQTLWKHSEGIDKDVRTLLTDVDAAIAAYVVRDTVRNRALLAEAINDFRRGEYRDRLPRLKVFWVPQDFNADDESARELVGSKLRDDVINDILFHVIFGNLTELDIRFFLAPREKVQIARQLAVLHRYAHEKRPSNAKMARDFKIRSDKLSDNLEKLTVIGFLHRIHEDYGFRFVSLKGRVLLAILGRLILEINALRILDGGTFTPEFSLIAERLGLNLVDDIRIRNNALERLERWWPTQDVSTWGKQDAGQLMELMARMGQVVNISKAAVLLEAMAFAEMEWQINFFDLDFVVDEREVASPERTGGE